MGEDRDEVDGVRIRALSGVECSRWVGHVRLVIGAVEVDTVPASGEENLGTHTVGTVVIEEVGTLGPIGITVMASAVVWRNHTIRAGWGQSDQNTNQGKRN